MNPMPICFLFVGDDIPKHIELDCYNLPVVYDIEFVECAVGIGKHIDRFHWVTSVFGGLECVHDNCRDLPLRIVATPYFPGIYLGQFDNL